MKHLFLLLFTASMLLANPPYPELFSQLGTPLYEAGKQFSKLPNNRQYSFDVSEYHKNQAKALELNNSGDKQAYFKALRELSKDHDKIISTLKREIMNAIKNDDYDSFISLSNAGIDIVYTQESFKKLNYDYYLTNRQKVRSPYLEKRIRSEKGYQKMYGVDISSSSFTASRSSTHHKRPNKVILLSRPGCGYCVKAKDFMRSQGISFTEYNIHSSSKGKSLFAKHNGSGIPLIIIGDEVIRGYSTAAILAAL